MASIKDVSINLNIEFIMANAILRDYSRVFRLTLSINLEASFLNVGICGLLLLSIDCIDL